MSVAGLGALVVTEIPVTPGEVLSINVGGEGGSGNGAGGYNGGGAGGGNEGTGGGGGASDVRQGGVTLGERILVASGGGGAGGGATFSNGQGGSGGGISSEAESGEEGYSLGGLPGSSAGGGGGGASALSGGSGGSAWILGHGRAGIEAEGGHGGGACTGNAGGGGGGGGYYGGGAGGGGCYHADGGGGGGSSFVGPTADVIEVVPGYSSGNGSVEITTPEATAASTPPQQATFAYNDGTQTYTVPEGVRSVTVQAAGGSGGGGAAGSGEQATVPVAPGQLLLVNAGGEGSTSSDGAVFNGGGAGDGTSGDGDSGGGGSDVRLGGVQAKDRVVVGGGGGGAGSGGNPGRGGAAGPAGAAGTPGENLTGLPGFSNGEGGGGATEVEGGAGGGAWVDGHGGTGGPGEGGNAGGPCNSNGGGGGGGGGYFGGGGGGGGCYGSGGGGGGGSDYVSPITSGASSTGASSGPGTVSIINAASGAGGGGLGSGGPPVSSHEVIRQVVFVHGINASCATPGTGEYKALYDALAAQGSSVYTFCYDHDLAFGEHSSGVSGEANRCFSNSGRQVAEIVRTANAGRERETSPHHIGPLYVSSNIGSAREIDDGDSALAYSAAKLDDCLGALVRYDVATYGHAVPIAVIGNSMGGAITRGWLELARSRKSTSLDGVTTVFLLEAATQGSWVARLGADVNELASSLPSPPGIPGGAVGSIVSTVLQEALQKFNLNPARAGVQDLAPQSAWYRSVAAGAPPLLHYFSLSTNIQLHVVVHDLWWTVGQGDTDFPGDGIMQLGSPAYNGLPEWGGSQFLPFGNGPDEHQYVISPHWTINTELSPVGAWTFLGVLAAIYTSGEHASHFNFGRYMGMESAQGQFTGGLEVSSCADGEPIGVPEEIARVFANPSDACSAAGPPVPVHALAQRLTAPAGSATVGEPSLWDGQRPPIRANSPALGNANTTAGAAVAATAAPAPLLEMLGDRDGRSTLAIGTVGPLHGELSLSVPGRGVFVARLHLPRGRVRLNRVVEAEHLATGRGAIVRLRLDGQFDLAAHSASLRIGIALLGIHVALVTAEPNYAQARANSKRLIAALRHNEVSELARMLAVPDAAAPTLSGELAGENVHVTSIRALGPGQPIWFADGNPGWRQPVIASAINRPTLHADLILEQQHSTWKLLGSATVR